MRVLRQPPPVEKDMGCAEVDEVPHTMSHHRERTDRAEVCDELRRDGATGFCEVALSPELRETTATFEDRLRLHCPPDPLDDPHDVILLARPEALHAGQS